MNESAPRGKAEQEGAHALTLGMVGLSVHPDVAPGAIVACRSEEYEARVVMPLLQASLWSDE